MAESNGDTSAAKIASLERERDKLATENAKKSEDVKKLKAEIERWCGDTAAEADTETARLRQEAEEARAEVAELRKVLEERECKVEILEREGRMSKQGNAESEMKVRDLERKVGVLEMKAVEERSKRVRVEEEMREKVDEKEREIEELDNVLIENQIELEKWLKENRDLRENVRVLELSVKCGFCGEEVKGLDQLKWPVVAAGSAGAIAVVVVLICFFFGKRR